MPDDEDDYEYTNFDDEEFGGDFYEDDVFDRDIHGYNTGW